MSKIKQLSSEIFGLAAARALPPTDRSKQGFERSDSDASQVDFEHVEGHLDRVNVEALAWQPLVEISNQTK
jgi:hypothetical protein